MTAIAVGFKVEKEDDEPEPLRMEHFYFPLGLWLGGLIQSAIFLLTEIMLHRRGKSQTDVARARLEEPSVTQSSPESENLGEMTVRLADTEGAEVDLAESENI